MTSKLTKFWSFDKVKCKNLYNQSGALEDSGQLKFGLVAIAKGGGEDSKWAP